MILRRRSSSDSRHEVSLCAVLRAEVMPGTVIEGPEWADVLSSSQPLLGSSWERDRIEDAKTGTGSFELGTAKVPERVV